MIFGNVLVTGGAGFVGSQLVKKLLPVSNRITIIDDLSTGNRSAIPESEQIEFYHDTVTNEQLLQQVLPDVDYVFHLSCRNLVLSAENLEADFHTNLYAGFFLLQQVQKHCSSLKKMVYTSTASVYGNAPIIPTPESYYQITMPYSASKFAVEHYCQVYIHMYQLPVTILRLSNLYGPGQLASNPYCGVVAKFFDAVQKGQPLTIYGNGQHTRDFTYIEDGVDAIMLAGSRPDTVGKVYNVGTGMETSVFDLAELVLQIVQKPDHPIQFEPDRTVDRVYRRALDSRLLQNDLGWKPNYTLEEGLTNTFLWLKRGEKQ